ncbi:MAG: GTP-binding protein HflX [Acidobacteria bacterium OLB17]|nr:MAG: GTP-binding protein HflX [Acidobacteria bacterium OLB17]
MNTEETRFTISKVSGFTRGLKHNQLVRIERLGTRRVPASDIVSPELARQMSEISHETGRQIGVLLNRKGQVEYVMVGNSKQIEMPDFGRSRVSTERFRGLRCVHTHLQGEKLTQDDLTDLALLRFDLMSIIQVEPKTGLPGMVYSAHLLPMSARAANSDGDKDASEPYQFLEPNIPSQLDTDLLELIPSLEAEMARVSATARIRSSGRERAILVGVTTGDIDEERESMTELEELTISADVTVVDSFIQRRPQIDPRTVLGRGKLDDLFVRSMRLGADLLIFDTELSPAQVRSLSEATELKVIDRPQLILDIFASVPRAGKENFRSSLPS